MTSRTFWDALRRLLLKGHGYSIETGVNSTGRTCWRPMGRQEFDILLIDLNYGARHDLREREGFWMCFSRA